MLKFNIMKTNYHEAGEFISFCRRNKLNYSIAGQIIPTLSGDVKTLDQRLEPEQLRKTFDEYGLEYKMSDSQNHICDVGFNAYLDCFSTLRGCPILRLETDRKIPKNNVSLGVVEQLKVMSQKIDRDVPVCEAWLRLEGGDNVAQFRSRFQSATSARGR